MTGTNPRTLLALASTAVALAAADTYVVVLALTDMMSGVGLGLDNLQRAAPIISGFLLGYIAVLPLIGRLADVISRSRPTCRAAVASPARSSSWACWPRLPRPSPACRPRPG